MHTIEIDFDVFKAITAKRQAEHITPNDVLREMFGLPKASKPALPERPAKDVWVTQGVQFPSDTRFKVTYKGKDHYAGVVGGVFVYKDKVFPSLSAAAQYITSNNVNGWRFWSFQLPNEFQWRKAHTALPRR